MRSFFCLIIALTLLQPLFAQRKYNKKHTPMHINMVHVPGGKFDMGDDTSLVDRKPAHTVILSDYYLSAYEITQQQWFHVMGVNPSNYTCGDCPVNNVNWDEVQTFIIRLNHMLPGRHFRLPTEAEWEYAARGGQLERIHNIDNPHAVGKQFAGRNLPQTVAWYSRNSDDHLHRVGVKQPNEMGIYDMSGNVEEWCNDFYADTYFTRKTVTNPTGPQGGASHVVRGGSYLSDLPEISVTRRAGYTPQTKSITLGFRLAEDMK